MSWLESNTDKLCLEAGMQNESQKPQSLCLHSSASKD